MTRPTVVVAGLGPAGPEFLTDAVRHAIERIPVRYLRTVRHPSATAVPGARSFDDLYDAADTFDEVYAGIVEQLVGAADEHGEILYAVPGSPLVLERTVQRLRADERIACVTLPALSFLDLAYDRLGIDPIEARLRLIDGHEFATAAAGERGPLLVAHCHADWVLSEIKLAVEEARGDEDVVILQRLGSPDERVVPTTWAELDRTVEADHLTSLYVPALAAPIGGQLVRFHEITRRLRAECPWDRSQTHESLARYALEETYELVEAIGDLGPDGVGDEELIGELGDVLLQVFLHAAIGEEEGRFSLSEVAETISDKMIRRHPHVFGATEVDDAEQVMANWQQIKAAERAASGDAAPSGTFDRIPGSLPALLYAKELGSAAAKIGVDWDEASGALAKVREELEEVAEAFDDPSLLAGELGDLLFATVNLARLRKLDPEAVLRQSAAKFRRRVERLVALAGEQGLDTATAGERALDVLWEVVKAEERR